VSPVTSVVQRRRRQRGEWLASVTVSPVLSSG